MLFCWNSWARSTISKNSLLNNHAVLYLLKVKAGWYGRYTQFKDKIMPISNAARWTEICEIQTKLMRELANQFPQRSQQLNHIADGWQGVKKQAQNNGVPAR